MKNDTTDNDDENQIEIIDNNIVDNDDSDISYLRVFIEISKMGIPLALSFSFSFEVWMAVILLKHLSTTPEEQAAATLVSIVMNTAFMLGVSPLFATMVYISRKRNEWLQYKEQNNLLENYTLSLMNFDSNEAPTQKLFESAVKEFAYVVKNKQDKLFYFGLQKKGGHQLPIELKTVNNFPNIDFNDKQINISTNDNQEMHKLLIENINRTISEKKNVISSYNANSLLMATGLAGLTTVMLYFLKDILLLLGQDPKVVEATYEFFKFPGYILAVFPAFFRMSFEQVMVGFGKTGPALAMSLPSLLIGGFFSWALGFGKFGFPNWGVHGVTAGFTLEALLTAIAYGLYVGLSKTTSEFEFFTRMGQKIKNNVAELKALVKKGGDFAFGWGIELGGIFTVGILSGMRGVIPQAAMAYIMQALYFESILLGGLSFSALGIISGYAGNKHFSAMKTFAKYGLITTLLYVAALLLPATFYPKLLQMILGKTTEDMTVIVDNLIRIMGPAAIIDAARFYLLTISRLSDSCTTNFISLATLVITMVSAAFLGRTKWGIYGVVAGYGGNALFATVGLTAYNVKHMRALERKTTLSAPCCLFGKSRNQKNVILLDDTNAEKIDLDNKKDDIEDDSNDLNVIENN